MSLKGEIPNYLTPKHIIVLMYVADGYTNEQISNELCISINTVKCHVVAIFERLGANNRPHAVAIAIRRGIIR